MYANLNNILLANFLTDGKLGKSDQKIKLMILVAGGKNLLKYLVNLSYSKTRMPYTDKEKEEIKEVLFHDLRYSVTNFDTLTITIGGGGLGVCLTFIDDIVPLKDAIGILFFYSAVALLTLGIVLSFIGHVWNIGFLYKELIGLVHNANYKPSRSPVIIFNRLIASCVIAGIASLCLFVICNVVQMRNPDNKKIDNVARDSLKTEILRAATVDTSNAACLDTIKRK
jgi:hypothetical protein